jgi:hypothetical protein
MTVWQEILVALGGNATLLIVLGFLARSLMQNLLAKDIKKFEVELKSSADAEIERLKNSLARDAKVFEMQMKANADAEIERVKAFLNRASRVHERQLDTLVKLHRHLYEAQGLLQRMTSAGRMEGEITPREYEPLVTKAMEAAFKELLDGRLLIPETLGKQCDEFFKVVFEGRTDFAFAHHPMIDPGKQAEFWKSAATAAYEKVPKLLQQIEDAARAVIHGATIA